MVFLTTNRHELTRICCLVKIHCVRVPARCNTLGRYQRRFVPSGTVPRFAGTSPKARRNHFRSYAKFQSLGPPWHWCRRREPKTEPNSHPQRYVAVQERRRRSLECRPRVVRSPTTQNLRYSSEKVLRCSF